MPSTPDRPFAEGGGRSPSPRDGRARGRLVETSVVVLVAVLALVYAIAAYQHESVEFPTVAPTAATASR
jgi:hypothetical protein